MQFKQTPRSPILDCSVELTCLTELQTNGTVKQLLLQSQQTVLLNPQFLFVEYKILLNRWFGVLLIHSAASLASFLHLALAGRTPMSYFSGHTTGHAVGQMDSAF